MTTKEISALTAPTQFARAADGVTYAYRRFGGASDVPLLMLQHFRGNIDNWDPAFIDALAAEREVILVDYAGDAVLDWGIPDHGALQRLTGIKTPTLIIRATTT